MNIPDARSTQDALSANLKNSTDVALTKVVVDAISTAVGAKANSATFSTLNKSGEDVMRVVQDLRRKGYKVDRSGTNITVSGF
jgi:peptidoglycan hydrolase-like protein with peptidoglycan-binding domain